MHDDGRESGMIWGVASAALPAKETRDHMAATPSLCCAASFPQRIQSHSFSYTYYYYLWLVIYIYIYKKSLHLHPTSYSQSARSISSPRTFSPCPLPNRQLRPPPALGRASSIVSKRNNHIVGGPDSTSDSPSRTARCCK